MITKTRSARIVTSRVSEWLCRRPSLASPALAALCAVSIAVGAGPVAAQVAALDAASSDAAVVVAIPSLENASRKLAKLNDALELGNPQMADALTFMKDTYGMREGLNESGAAMLVIPDAGALAEAMKDGSGKRPEPAMLMPVSDYGAFVGNFGGDPGESITSLEMPGKRPAFARSIEGYAVLSPSREVVAAYEPGGSGAAMLEKAGQMNRQVIEGGDAFALVNVEALGAALKPQIDQMMQVAESQMEARAESDPNFAANLPMAKAMLQVYGQVARQTLSDGSYMAAGLSIEEAGVNTSASASFKPDTYLAKAFAGAEEDASGEFLRRLPGGSYIAAAALNLRGVDVSRLVEDTMSALPQDAGPMVEMVRSFMPLMKVTQGMAQVSYPPQGNNVSQSLFGGVTLIETSDPSSYREGIKAYVESLEGRTMPMGPAANGEGQQELTFEVAYRENDIEVDGTAVDLYEVSYTFPPEMMAQMGQFGGLMAMFGMQSQKGYVATKADHVVMTNTTDTAMLRRALTSVAGQEGLGSHETMRQVRETHLTPQPAAEGYLSVNGVVETVNTVMAMFSGGQATPIEAPADLPPIAGSVSVENGSVMKRLHVPMRSIQYVKKLADQFGALGPPRAGGGAGGPAPAPR